MQNKSNVPHARTKTGNHPKAELTSFSAQEPPDTLPEAPDPGGTTGIMRIVTEGTDATKDRDDSAPESRR